MGTDRDALCLWHVVLCFWVLVSALLLFHVDQSLFHPLPSFLPSFLLSACLPACLPACLSVCRLVSQSVFLVPRSPSPRAASLPFGAFCLDVM